MIYFHNLVTIYGLLISVIPRPLNYWAHTVTGCGYTADLHSHCRFLWKLQMAQTRHCHMNILFHSFSLASSRVWRFLSSKCIKSVETIQFFFLFFLLKRKGARNRRHVTPGARHAVPEDYRHYPQWPSSTCVKRGATSRAKTIVRDPRHPSHIE